MINPATGTETDITNHSVSGDSKPDWQNTLPDAVYVSQSVPTFMIAGQPYQVTVTMKNVGATTWDPAALYRLGSRILGQRNLGRASSIVWPGSPGQQAVFNFTVTAPAKGGRFNFQWRMVQDGVEWLGDFTPNVLVAVAGTGTGYLGCYTDSSFSPHALPVLLGSSNETIESCKKKTTNAGYDYTGLQSGGQCWAGQTLGFTKVSDWGMQHSMHGELDRGLRRVIEKQHLRRARMYSSPFRQARLSMTESSRVVWKS